ncbi:antirestriction protein ArdA [Actinomyces minihominis]|uniref:antirestriction protein ArdA n=1 Tax=Actinomyces minihominis TaxID=2002838 RepID=UPI000C088FA4|nr:antirestriction protein ArdA [Actinomyces minihominis]
MSTRTLVGTPRVWVSSHGAYNSGHLIGLWVDAAEAVNVTPEDVFEHSLYDYSPDEKLWCFDTENLLTDSEMSPERATQEAELLSEVGGSVEQDALRAWYRDGSHVEDSDGLPDLAAFRDRFRGEYDCFTDFVEEYIESTDLLAEMPSELREYFDVYRYADSIEQDFNVVEASSGYVYVFAAN